MILILRKKKIKDLFASANVRTRDWSETSGNCLTAGGIRFLREVLK